MEQKRVSFKVANALKEAGYPQGNENSGNCAVYPLEDHDDNYTEYTRIGKITTRYTCETWRILSSIPYVVAPTYLEAWLWLWREGKYRILLSASNQRWNEVHGIVDGVNGIVETFWHKGLPGYDATNHNANSLDPEGAIIAAIEYLADKNLIK